MTISFQVEAVTRTENLLLVTINEEKRRALRITKNHIKLFGQVISLEEFGQIPVYKDSRQLILNLTQGEKENVNN